MSNNTFNGILATLEFEISTSASGDYPVTVSYYKGRNGNYEDGSDVNYDENFSPINLKYVNGKITVSTKNSIDVSNIENGNTLKFKMHLNSSETITGVMITAVYDTDSKLIAVKSYKAAKDINCSFSDISNAEKIKIFWWNSVESLNAISNVKIVDLK